MAINVAVFDSRLEGRTPLGSPSILGVTVGGDVLLDEFFSEISLISRKHDGISVLFLMTQMEQQTGKDDEPGLAFCKEGVRMANVEQFAKLGGAAKEIVVFQCFEAPESSDFQGCDTIHEELSRSFHGDGDELCRAIARHAHTKVTVVREVEAYAVDEHMTVYSGYELYCETGAIDYSDWEGSIISFDQFGNLIEEVTNPLSWRDSHGVIQDPRLESAR